MRRLALTVLVLGLLTGTTTALALTQALKLERSPVTAPRFDRVFSPTCGCPTNEARLSLTLRRADTVDADVVDEDGEPVRRLVSGARRGRGVVTFVWDGSSDGGAIAPDGSYRLRIRLRDQHRTIVIPTPVHVDTAPPEVELLRVSPTVFSPDRDRRRDRVVVVFRVSERSRALLFVDGRAAVRGRLSPAGRKRVFWGGKVDGRLRRPGSYSLTVRAHDRAGNVSARTDPVSVRIRYIELPVKRVEVRRLGTLRFRVATDARRFRWSLVPAGRSSRPLLTGRGTRVLVVTRLPRSVKPGRYRLRVEEGGYGDEAVVVVRKAKR